MNLFDSISIGASGMSAQRLRAEVLTENLANAETTRTAEGGPYRRRDVVFTPAEGQTSFRSILNQQLAGVEVAEVTVDTREPDRRYMPGHPDADKNGYVGFPNVNSAEEMVDLMSATRGYQANVAAVSAMKDMIQRTIDLFR
jgi:flagellar basal-body rod protein FlgC